MLRIQDVTVQVNCTNCKFNSTCLIDDTRDYCESWRLHPWFFNHEFTEATAMEYALIPKEVK